MPVLSAQAPGELGMGVIRIRYPADVTEPEKTENAAQRVGLCLDCLHSQRIRSARGSTFYRCELSDTDSSFPKYPRLPVLRCAGYAQAVEKS